MLESNIKSPGVYINEVNAFPNSVVPVATAVPAFIGYTPQAVYEGRSYTNVARKINSMADFEAIYCLPDPPLPAEPSVQYRPQYYLVPQLDKHSGADVILIDGKYYELVPDPNTIYYLYNSIRLFYQNGGGDAYIVSVGGYGAASLKASEPTAQPVNSNVNLNDLLNGLSVLRNEEEPTMYICPEATLLSVSENATLMQAMLLQCTAMQTAISIFDVIGGNNPHPVKYVADIAAFRISTGMTGLNYGTAYYPFVGTTVMQAGELNYTNLFGDDIKQLQQLLAKDQPAIKILDEIQQAQTAGSTIKQYDDALKNGSATYTAIMKLVLATANILPPSGGVAGMITTVDNQSGVWQAPANISIVGVSSLPINLSESQQAGLNVDAITGKSINAIRSFDSIGILVWGARTLDGNSQDWKYLPVRRTMTFIEQSCKLAAHAYVFQPNVKNTWEAVKAMISSFLTTIWKQGGLQGAAPADAFSVDCGLGTTMTADDILNGLMNVAVKVAVARPEEFIVLTFQQQMAVAN